MFLVKLFIRLCVLRGTELSGRGWKEQHGDKPEVMVLLYPIVAWMFIGWLLTSHSLWASERWFSIEEGTALTRICCVTLGMLLNLSEPRFPSSQSGDNGSVNSVEIS